MKKQKGNATIRNYLQETEIPAKRIHFKIKKSMFWNQSIILSKHYVNHNLFITHPIMQNIQNLFYYKYNVTNLIEDIFKINIPMTLQSFKQEFNNLNHQVKKMLQHNWLVDVARILDNHVTFSTTNSKNTNSMIVPFGEKLLKCVNTLLSIQMRIIMLNTLNDIKHFFRMYTIQSVHDKALIYSVPFIIVEINFNEELHIFETYPTLKCFHEQMKCFLNDLINITREISVIDLSNVLKLARSYNLFSVSAETDLEIKTVTTKILDIITVNIGNPRELMERYNKFIPILDGTFETELNNIYAAESNLSLKRLHNEIKKYHDFTFQLSKFPNQVQWNFVEVDCSSINKLISKKLKIFYKELCTHLLTNLKNNNSGICKLFDDVANKISESPESTKEVVELCSYLSDCKDTTMYHLRSKLNKSSDLLLFLVEYYPLSNEDIVLNIRTFTWPKEMEKILELGITRLNLRKEMLENTLKTKRSNCVIKVEEIKLHIHEFKKKDLPLLNENEAKICVNLVDNLAQSMDIVTTEAKNISEEEGLLDMEFTSFSSLMNMNQLVKSLHLLWHSTYDFIIEYDKWFYKPVQNLNIHDILNHLKLIEEVLFLLPKDVINISAVRRATEILKNKIDNFKKYLPLLEILCNQCFRERHWDDVSNLIGHKFDSDTLNLSSIINYEFDKHISNLTEISSSSTKEYELKQNLNKMHDEWKDKYFYLELYRNTEIAILKQADDIQMLLDEHILKLQTLRSQPNVEVFINDIVSWEEKLILIQDIIDEWLSCQTTWVNLEPIFNSDDISWQMPTESEEFKEINIMWRSLMESIRMNPRVLDITNIENVIDKFKSCNAMLHEINKSLDDYLDRKRSLFARFYFLTNKEISNLISISKNLTKIQTQLYKCFEGIFALQATKDEEIIGIITTQNECIPFSNRIYFSEMKGFIEKWLIQVEDNMKSSIRDICQDTINSYNHYNFTEWILCWPGQSVICCYQIYWTSYIAESIVNKNSKDLQKKQSEEIKDMLNLLNEELQINNFTKVTTLITLNLHFNDIINTMNGNNYASLLDFDWLSQIRYYWLNGNITISNITTNINYGFECIGNNSRLVITPLSDRCLTLIMSAMKLNLYAALEGPTGSGKTEILRDFSKMIARKFVLLYGSPYIEYKLLNNLFKGIMQSGAWLCLDNLYETKQETLSIIIQQILSVQTAINSRTDVTNFEGTDIKLNPSCYFFATLQLSPSLHEKIPINIKLVFRTVAVIQPDYKQIVEVRLSAYGITTSNILSLRIINMIQLLSNQLTNKKYIFNMYLINAILRRVVYYKFVKLITNEEELILSALKDVILPKISNEEYDIFESVCNTLFYNSGITINKDDEFNNYLIESLRENYSGLILNEWYISKINELHESLNRKQGVILIGDHLNGKTLVYTHLLQTLNLITDKAAGVIEEKKITRRIINPTSVSFEELYGKYDSRTQEWIDGLFTKICREFAAHDCSEKKWIIFDGVADRVWMEYLNPIFDERKQLHLTSGEIIKISDSVSIIMELINLNDASPATVCRCGIINMDSNKVGWKDVFTSFKSTNCFALASEQLETVFQIIEWLTEPILMFLNTQSKLFVRIKETHQFCMFIKIFETLLKTESNVNTLWMQCTLLFSLIWGLCSTMDNSSRKTFDTFFRNLLMGKVIQFPKPKTFNLSRSQLFPETATVFEWIYDKINNGTWLLWIESIPKKIELRNLPNDTQIIQTTETCIMNFFLSMNIIHQNNPIIFLGPSGTGKTVVSLNFLNNLPTEKYDYNYITLSVSLPTRHLQKLITNNLDRRRKEVYGPTMGKYCIMYIDDLNFQSNNVESIELLRQWIEHAYLTDYDSLTFSYLTDITLLGSLCSSNYNITTNMKRFIHHAHLIGIDNFSNDTITKIFTALLDVNFANLNMRDLSKLSKDIITVTLNVFQKMVKDFTPDPKSRYCVFHLNDIHRVVKGLCLLPVKHDTENKEDILIKLWIHEMYRNFFDRFVSEKYRSVFCNILQHFSVTGIPGYVKMSTNMKEIDTDMSDLMFSPVINSRCHIKLYEEIGNINSYKENLEKLLIDYKKETNLKFDFVFFKYAIHHVQRILRILLLINEHIILAGLSGTGKSFNAKLVSIVTNYEINEMIHEVDNYEKWRKHMKSVLTKVGVTNCKLLFKINTKDVHCESYLHDVHTLVCSGNILSIFTAEEKTDIVKKMIDQFDAEKSQAYANTNEILNIFCNRIRSNVHIIFIITVKQILYKSEVLASVRKYCTIDCYVNWPKESLQSVASHVLQQININQDSIEKFKQIFEFLHRDMNDALTENKGCSFITKQVTPVDFCNFMNCFVDSYNRKLKSVLDKKNQYDIGLAKLNQVANQVGVMQTELRDLQPKLLAKSQLSDKLMIKIEQDTINVEARKEVVAADEALANEAAAAAQAIKDDCESDLAEASPALETALTALDTLKHSDITIIKSMKNPPPGVRLVMEAVCVLKGIKPEKVQDPITGQMIDDYWQASIKLLGDIKFLENLKTFDKDNIPVANMKRIRENYMNNRSFQPDIIRKTSTACEGLCKWIRAMEVYDRVIKVVAPKKTMLLTAEAELTVQMETLNSKRALLQDVTDKLQQLNDEFAECLREKRDLENQIDLCIQKLDRAEKLLGGLNNERIRWNETTMKLDKKCGNMIGDILLASAFITYLAYVECGYRKDIMDKWISFCKQIGIPFNDKFVFHEIYMEKEDLKSWNVFGLPISEYLIDNAVIIKESNRYPLIIDPHWLANKWIKNIEKNNKISIVDYNNPNYFKQVLQCMEIGQAALIENVSEIDKELCYLLQRNVYECDGETMMRLMDESVKYNDNFRLYVTSLSTDLLGLSDIAVHVTPINFSVTPEGLSQNLLKLIVAEKLPAINFTKENLRFEYMNNNRTLQEIEHNILRMLSSTEGNILDDEVTIKSLSSSKNTAEGIRMKQISILKSTEEIEEKETVYVFVARHATNIFFAIEELKHINHMYRFSIQWFFQIFVNIIKNSSAFAGEVIDTDKLLYELNVAYYNTVCKSLFYDDRIIFSFILTVFLLRGNNQVDEEMLRLLLNINVNITTNEVNVIPWMSSVSWSLVSEASKFSSFKDWDKLMLSNLTKWKHYYYASDPLSCSLPEPFNDNENDLKSLIIVRCLRPEKMLMAIKNYITKNIGSYLLTSTTFDIGDVCKECNNTFPILMISSQAVAPINYIRIAARKLNLQRKQLVLLSLNENRLSFIMAVVKKSMRNGEWVVIQNCHVFGKLIGYLDWSIENLVTSSKVHSNFKLWLTSGPVKDFPVSLIVKCEKIVFDEKASVHKNDIISLASEAEPGCLFNSEGNAISWKRLILSTYLLHLILQERTYYRPYGWKGKYAFDDAILKSNLGYVKILGKYYNNLPLCIYKYYIEECVYGSDMSDLHDRKSLHTLKNIHLDMIFSNKYNDGCKENLYTLLKNDGSNLSSEYFNSQNIFELTGLNQNAYMKKELCDSEIFLKKLSSTKNIFSIPNIDSVINSTTVEKMEEIQKRIPSPFDIKSIENKLCIKGNNVHMFLMGEIYKYNNLIGAIKDSLQKELEILNGVKMIDICSNIYDDIEMNEIPQIWKQSSYPTEKSLGSYIDDLIKRSKFYHDWIENTSLNTIWISGLFSIAPFITAILMDYSLKCRAPFENIIMTYEITPFENNVKENDLSGTFIYGLYLDGARWNRVKKVLDECIPNVILDPIPVIYLKPDINASLKGMKFYFCPAYVLPSRTREVLFNINLNQGNSCIPFPSENPESHWIYRSIACICQNNN